MLRITREANGQVVFKVSGQLTADNVAEMEALIAAETKGKQIVLDCRDLRSVDGAAEQTGRVQTIYRVAAEGVRLERAGAAARVASSRV
jgi:MFS superfamily sulfate permease-like transporter